MTIKTRVTASSPEVKRNFFVIGIFLFPKSTADLFSVFIVPDRSRPEKNVIVSKRSRRTEESDHEKQERQLSLPETCLEVVINLSSFALGLHQITKARWSAVPEQEAVVRWQSAGERGRNVGNG